MAAACWSLALLMCPMRAQAEQPRDFMLRLPPDGGRFYFDYFGTGIQAGLEHRTPIYGPVNTLQLGVSTLQTMALGQLEAEAHLRILFLRLGVRAAYRAEWRSMTFEQGDDFYCKDCDRAARREIDPLFGRAPNVHTFGFVEPRVQVYMPFNEYLTAFTMFAARHSGRRDLSYDYIFTNIHDGGWVYRLESFVFLKHRKWGGIGPYVQTMWLPRNGRYEVETAVGFNATFRLGLLRRNDLLFFTFLTRPSDPIYGQHNYYLPMRALINYRMILEL